MITFADTLLVLCAELRRWAGIVLDRPGDVFEALLRAVFS